MLLSGPVLAVGFAAAIGDAVGTVPTVSLQSGELAGNGFRVGD